MLYLGKWTSKKNKEFVPSFNYTAARLNRLYGMAKEDNPYAETALIDIDFHFDEMQELTKKVKIVARNCIKDAERKGIKTILLYKKEPYVKKISFVTEYTMCLTKMLSSVDEAIRYIRTANLSNELSKSATIDLITALRRKTRMIFTKIVTYANRIRAGVKRVHIEERSAIAKGMINKFGIPSQKIMNREITYRMHRVTELAI